MSHPAATRRRAAAVLAVLLACTLTSRARAADIEVKVQSREAYVGVPMLVTVSVEGTDISKRPVIGEVPGAVVESLGGESRQEFTRIVNGRVTRRTTLTYTFRLTPKQEGTITIPPVTAAVDGKKVSTGKPIEIIVRSVSASGAVDGVVQELLAVSVSADRETIYLGEPVSLTMRVWLRPFRDRRYGTLSDGQMWNLVSSGSNSWGPFEAKIREFASQRRRPRGRDVIRADDLGEQRAYYAFDIPTIYWPTQTGPLEFDDITLVVEYPKRIQRDFFEYRVAESQPVAATAVAPDVTVLAPPEAGRPPTFNGAVGRFDVSATAKPTSVMVGDPITLTIEVTDRSPGETRLALLPAPPLHESDLLTADFDIPTDPLAGVVEDRVKTFTQTLRARRGEVTAIPPIQFSFFDPKTRQYATVETQPIAITVTAGVPLAMTDVVGGSERTNGAVTELTATAGGLLANYSDEQELLASHDLRLGLWFYLLIAIPPLMFTGIAVSRRVSDHLNRDQGAIRRRRARREAVGIIRRAAAAASEQQSERVGVAVRGYVADRLNLPAGGLTVSEVSNRLRAANASAPIIEQIEQLLARCETSIYAPGERSDDTKLPDEAIHLIDRLEREKLR